MGLKIHATANNRRTAVRRFMPTPGDHDQ